MCEQPLAKAKGLFTQIALKMSKICYIIYVYRRKNDSYYKYPLGK